jgi:hypothetical protein
MPLRIALRTFDGRYYVCAEGGGGRELVANRQQLGPWETFQVAFVDPWNNLVTLKTWDDSCYVAAGWDGGMCTGPVTAPGAAHTFKLEHLGGRQISLLASTGKYVCSENGGGHVLAANRDACGPWETFLLEVV